MGGMKGWIVFQAKREACVKALEAEWRAGGGGGAGALKRESRGRETARGVAEHLGFAGSVRAALR